MGSGPQEKHKLVLYSQSRKILEILKLGEPSRELSQFNNIQEMIGLGGLLGLVWNTRARGMPHERPGNPPNSTILWKF